MFIKQLAEEDFNVCLVCGQMRAQRCRQPSVWALAAACDTSKWQHCLFKSLCTKET